MKKIKYLITIVILFCISISCLTLVACSKSNGGGDTPPSDVPTSTVVLSQHSVTLEKLEKVTLVADVEGDYDEIIWLSTNTEVASVVNGEIKALSEGSAIIKCQTSDAEDKCLVTVKDSKLTLNITTNINSEELNLLKGDYFDIDYFVTYNNKIVDANVNILPVNDSEIVELNGKKLTAKTNGQAKIIVKAEWEGLSVEKVFDVNVVNNFTAKLLEQPQLTMCNDPNGGLFSVQLLPELYENDELLNEDEYELVSFSYDEKVINVDEDTLVVTALSRGNTELEATFTSKSSSNTVVAVLPIKVELYNQDKYDSIRIPDAYVSENSYEIKLGEVFADLDDSALDGLDIVRLADVTGTMPVELKVENGIVDLSYFSVNDILGERKWRVETEKYSYDVKIVLEKFNYVKPLVGKYAATNWEYGIEIKFDNRQKTVNFYDAATKEVKYEGSFELSAWDEDSGRINITGFPGQNNIGGVYWTSSGKVFIDLNIYATGGYVYLYSESGAPYEEISGIYKNDVTWLVDFKLNSDKTCVFDYNNDLSKKCNGTYELTSIDAYSGKIFIEIESAFFGQTAFEGNYYLEDGLYYFDVYVDVLEDKQKLTQTGDGAVYDSFAGYYTASPTFLPIKFTKDRTVIFDYLKWGGNVNTTGKYELIGDANSGTIIINLDKAYAGNKQFTGTYELNNGVYVFAVVIPGSGLDIVNYKQKI